MHLHARTLVIAAGSTLALFGVAMAAATQESAIGRIIGNATTLVSATPTVRPTTERVYHSQRIGYDETVMPLPNAAITTAFGPGPTPNDLPVFNLGIELSGDKASPVHAVADGDVFLAEGAVVILRHTADTDIVTEGERTRRWYSMYAPVDTTETLSPHAPVRKGDVIGALPGGIDTLRFETILRRAGSAARIAHAASPMRFLPYVDGAPVEARVESLDPLTVVAATDINAPTLDEVRVKTAWSTVLLDFGTREGFTVAEDGSITPAVARIDVVRRPESERLEYTFVFEEVSNVEHVLVRDVWGRGAALHP